MSRGKQFTPESAEATETVAASDEAELKARGAGAKVTLVKPLQAEPSEEAAAADEIPVAQALTTAEAAPAKKPRARPKVGRSSNTRKKKSEGGEKKAGKSKSKSASKAASRAAAKIEGSLTEENKVEAQPDIGADSGNELLLQAAESVPASEPLRIEQLQAELKKMELSTDYWELTQPKPWSFGKALLVVVLFIGVSWSLMELFSHGGHKSTHSAAGVQPGAAETADTPAPEATVSGPAVTPGQASTRLPQSIAPLPPALPVVPKATVQAATAGLTPVAATSDTSEALVPAAGNTVIAPLAATVAPPSNPATVAAGGKKTNQQELFSILNKDQ